MKQVIVKDVLNVSVDDVPTPHAGKGQIRIKIAYAGICGSDVHIYKGEHPLLEGNYPTPIGHEFSGIIDEIGEGVQGYHIGQPATVQPVRSCGECWTCKAGVVAVCPKQTFYMDGMAEYFVADAPNIIALEDGTSLEDAAMIEPLAVAIHAVKMVPEIKGDSVLVSGGGTIGILVALAAKYYGAGKVIVTDLIEKRLDISEKLGMIPVNPVKEDLGSRIIDITNESNIRTSFECVGSEKSLANCVKYADRRGTIVVLGVFAQPPRVDMFRIEDREIVIRGALEYTWEDFREAAGMVEKKALNLDMLRTRYYPLKDIEKAFEFIINNPGDCIKVMLKI